MAEERDRVGAALQRSQTQFEAFLNHSPSGIVLKDREGRYLLANRRVQEWQGKSQEEILGRTTSDLFAEDLAEQAETDDRSAERRVGKECERKCRSRGVPER